MELLTIGYQGKSPEELTRTLQLHEVELVLDVREYAWSRKPGFSKSQLNSTLEAARIDYVHDRRLGSPLHMRKAYRSTGDWVTFEYEYGVHLGSIMHIVQDYAEQLANKRICLLCFEVEPWLCHRLALADAFSRLMDIAPAHL